MNTDRLFCAILLLLAGCSAVSPPDTAHQLFSGEATDTVTNLSGVISLQGETVVIVVDTGEGYDTAYQPNPETVPARFRVDELPIVFSGIVREIPPNVRMFGQPIDLTDIRTP